MNDFSGMISPKLSRPYQYFPRLLIANLSSRLSIWGFCRNFVDIYREFSETTGKIPELEVDRNEPNSVIYRLNLMSDSCSLNVFGQCPILSTGKYPIKYKDVKIHPKLSKVIQEYPALSRNVKLGYFYDSSSCTGCPWACFAACIRSRDTTDRPTLCICHRWCISLLPAVPWVRPLSFCYLVSMTDSVASHCDMFCDVKVMNLICYAKHNWLLIIGS